VIISNLDVREPNQTLIISGFSLTMAFFSGVRDSSDALASSGWENFPYLVPYRGSGGGAARLEEGN